MTTTAAPSAVRGQIPGEIQTPSESRPLPGLTVLVPPAASGAAAVLAVSSTGSMVVAAVLLGIGARSRWTGAAAVLATAAVAMRFSTADFGDVAGIQSVLGAAGIVGPPAAAASAWVAAAAVLLAVRASAEPDPPGRALPGAAVLSFLPAVAGGALAAAIVAGPGPGGDLILRVVATVAAIVIGTVLTLTDRRPGVLRIRMFLAVVAGVVAVILASWPG